MTVEDYVNAFKNLYNYDDIDEKDFEHPNVIAAIKDDIEECKEDNFERSAEDMADIVKTALHCVQYGYTSDSDDLAQIDEDMKNRFPNGR